MTRHIQGLSQRARLVEFVFSESGAMNAKKAAQMGAVLAASALAGLLMSARTAEACCTSGDPSCTTCSNDVQCGMGNWCRSRCCSFGGVISCTNACTAAQDNYC